MKDQYPWNQPFQRFNIILAVVALGLAVAGTIIVGNVLFHVR